MTVVPAVIHRWNGHKWTCLLCGNVSADPCDCPCCQHRAPSGLLVVSTRRATVGLTVRNGVVQQAPPYGRRWVGKSVNAVLAETWGWQNSVIVTWLADAP